MTEIITSRVISCAIFDPRNTIFKQVANSRSLCTTLSCTLESCPLLDAKTCVQSHPLGSAGCPYGSRRREEGFTKRAGKCSGWISGRRERYNGIPQCNYPPRKMAFVGDYVYLPYHHMDMNKKLESLKNCCFLPRSGWTLDTVCCVLDFRPRSWGGNTIASYADEEMPKFLSHIRELDPAMWAELCAERPALDTTPNHVGRKAILATLNSPIEWSTAWSAALSSVNRKYPVHWRWDGERVYTTSKHAYNSTWGDLKIEDLTIGGRPVKGATVVVRDNDWVNDSTVFVD